jgi:hypothetical protein
MLFRSTLSSSSWRTAALLFTGAAFLFACASNGASTKKKRDPVDPGDDYLGTDPPPDQGLSPTTNADSGAFGAPSRPSTSAKDGGGSSGSHVDASVDAGGGDDGGIVVVAKTYCAVGLAAGDLAITELLVTSRSGQNDDGEWVEIRSTRSCWLKVKGLTIESPRGVAAPDTITIAEDYEVEPNGSFIVADSLDPAKNHALPGKVFAWGSSDVLKNDGDTVSLKVGATVIDTLTYPAFSNLEPGRTLAFPDDCPSNVRNDWERWSLTFDTWQPGFEGTPNATNDDVACY